MDKTEILDLLKMTSGVTSLKLPENLGIESKDGILILKMSQKGLTGNMQTDAAAFDGWAISIKAALPEIARKVIIQWNGLGWDSGKDYNHYRRFLYRLLKFQVSYDWAEGCPLDSLAEEDWKRFMSELGEWVVNYPDSESKEDASKEEARLERLLKEKLRQSHDNADHQLPMGLFYQDKSITNERTPSKGSQIDLWSISDGKITIYELKKDNNRKVGIISELMFYVNVVQDLCRHKLHFAKGAENVDFRSFQSIHDILTSISRYQVVGVFLTNDLHPLLAASGSTLFTLLNDNNRSIRYKQMGYTISEIVDL